MSLNNNNDNNVEFTDYFNERNEVDLNMFSSENSENKNSKSSKSKKARSKRGKKTKANVLKIVLSVFLVGVITGCIVIGAFMIYAFCILDATMPDNLNNLALNYTTTIYTKDNNTGEFVEYQRLHGEQNRIWVSYDKIPNNLKNAFIAIEDKRFMTHGGVDWKRTFSAFANLFLHFYSSNQGGSTITQQLVKNLTGDASQSPARKMREIMRARNLEAIYSKDTILECYINTVAMGGGSYGAEVAANYYYGKSASELTLGECASLAAIVKAPSTYRPDLHPDENNERRKTVLSEMKKQGYITEEEYNDAVNDVPVVIADKSNIKEEEINNYFVDALIEDVVNGLVDVYGYDKSYASRNFYNGGYKIYATLQPEVQNAMDEVYSNEKYLLKTKKGSELQGAMVVMDYYGHINGMVGGIGKKTTNRGFNCATSASRQPGSTMKPMAAYAPAIEYDKITYSTIMDARTHEVGPKKWLPKNWYNDGYVSSHLTMGKAIEVSTNTIPVYLVDSLTPQLCYDFITQKLGLSHLNSNDIDYSPLGMGGTNGGVTTLEEAAAYSTFGNGGLYYTPTTYYYVTDQHDNVILKYNDEPIVAMGEDTATVMNHLLRNVTTGSQGTAADIRNSSLGKFQTFAKTGTTNENMNCWMTGGTPYYIASSWCGYDPLQEVYPSNTARRMWTEVMSKIHNGLDTNKQFADSSYCVSEKYCTSTGMIATESCPNTDIGWYKKSNIPAKCTTHAAA